MSDVKVCIGDRIVMAHEAGAADGFPVVHFHGTPGSRLEPAFGADIAQQMGARIISFDRPGYGQSDAGPIDLLAVAKDVEAIVDQLGVSRFAAFGWSGGGPFALAAAAALGNRVSCVGVSGGLAPVQQIPAAFDALTESDHRALACLPDDPAGAAECFFAGNEELLTAMVSVKDDETAPWIDWMWGVSDAPVIAHAAARGMLQVSFREALRQGAMAVAWDNVAFVGPWGFDLADVMCPVHLWYGSRDQMAPPVNGQWLADHLTNAELTIFESEGHLLPFRHWTEMLPALIGEHQPDHLRA